MSLVRLERAEDKRERALVALSDVYAWFSEGLETRDLEEARLLIEESATNR
jgi:hypothetical protein